VVPRTTRTKFGRVFGGSFIVLELEIVPKSNARIDIDSPAGGAGSGTLDHGDSSPKVTGEYLDRSGLAAAVLLAPPFPFREELADFHLEAHADPATVADERPDGAGQIFHVLHQRRAAGGLNKPPTVA
jgi:hypothetical protein